MELGQKIFVTTSLLLKPQIFKMHFTFLKDAYTSKFEKEMRIELGQNHNWGALPTRVRSEVVIEPNDLDAIFKSRLNLPLMRENEVDKNRVYVVDFMNQNLTIDLLTYSNTVNSLRDGHYKVYSAATELGTISIKVPVGEDLQKRCFYTIDEAFKEYKEILTNQLY
jgi:hypothetical protein